jgi:hypothetical protein
MTSSSGNNWEQSLRLLSLTERVVSVRVGEGGRAAIPMCWASSETSISKYKAGKRAFQITVTDALTVFRVLHS